MPYKKYAAKKGKKSKTVKAKQTSTISKKVATLSRAVREATPELKWYRTGGNYANQFAEYNSATGDGAPFTIGFNMPLKGTDSNQRIGNQINVRKIEVGFGIKSTQLNFTIDYKVYIILYKERLTTNTLTLAQMIQFLEADTWSAAANGNAITPRSYRNPDFMKDFQVLKVVSGRAVPQNAKVAGDTQWYREHRFTIGKNFKIRFAKDFNTGTPIDCTNNSLHMILVAGNESDVVGSGNSLQLRKLNLKVHYSDD